MFRTAAIAIAATVMLTATPALGQSTASVTAGERTVSIGVPAGYTNLGDISATQASEILAFTAEGETALMVVVDESIDPDANWRAETYYALVSVLDNSLGGTISSVDFRSQIDFLRQGLTDMSPMAPAEAAGFVDAVLADGEVPPRLADPGALEGLQVLEFVQDAENTAALTLTHPIPDGTLLINDIGFVLIDGQMFKIAAFGVLQDAGTIAGLQAFSRAIRDQTLAAN